METCLQVFVLFLPIINLTSRILIPSFLLYPPVFMSTVCLAGSPNRRTSIGLSCTRPTTAWPRGLSAASDRLTVSSLLAWGTRSQHSERYLCSQEKREMKFPVTMKVSISSFLLWNFKNVIRKEMRAWPPRRRGIFKIILFFSLNDFSTVFVRVCSYFTLPYCISPMSWVGRWFPAFAHLTGQEGDSEENLKNISCNTCKGTRFVLEIFCRKGETSLSSCHWVLGILLLSVE